MRETRRSFKYALRKCRRQQKKTKANKVAMFLSGQKPDQFWSLIRQEMGSGTALPLSFGNITGSGNIANMWQQHFSSIFNNQSCSSNDEEFLSELFNVQAAEVPCISPEDVCCALSKLKDGKSPGWDHLSNEHLLHLETDVLSNIAVLFNSMLNHSALPDRMIYSLLVPLVKDKSGTISDKSNYRAIALSTSLSKLLELVLVDRIAPFLSTSDAQFGFKEGHSTTLATYVFKETVNFYTSHGSPVYACFMDASKAFDRVCHLTLFRVLADRGVPLPYLKLLLVWYRTQKMAVKWADSESDLFLVQNGVRQGGNLSPLLFNVYIDSIISELREMKVGCIIGKTVINVLAYADDIVLLAPTREGLEDLD